MPLSRDFTPRLMPVETAAHYLGLSDSGFRSLGIPSKQLGGKTVYDRVDLDQFADGLSYKDKPKGKTCENADQVWG